MLARLSFPIHDVSGGDASSMVWALCARVNGRRQDACLLVDPNPARPTSTNRSDSENGLIRAHQVRWGASLRVSQMLDPVETRRSLSQKNGLRFRLGRPGRAANKRNPYGIRFGIAFEPEPTRGILDNIPARGAVVGRMKNAILNPAIEADLWPKSHRDPPAQPTAEARLNYGNFGIFEYSMGLRR